MRNVLSPTWLTFLISWLSDVLLLHKSYTCVITPTNFNENFVIHSLKFGYCFLKMSGMVFFITFCSGHATEETLFYPLLEMTTVCEEHFYVNQKDIRLGRSSVNFLLSSCQLLKHQNHRCSRHFLCIICFRKWHHESILPSWLLDRGTVASLFKWILQFEWCEGRTICNTFQICTHCTKFWF